MGGFEDLFDMFGGGGRRRQQQKRKRKVKPTVKEVKITLEDAYNGKSIKLDNKRTVICDHCDGQGGFNVEECDACGGTGIVIKTQMIGPGMYQRIQCPCEKCKGKGKVSLVLQINLKNS